MKNILFLILTLVIVSCVSNNKTEYRKRIPAEYGKVNGSSSDGLNFEKLVHLLKESDAKNMEEALAAISSKYPDHLNFYTLMYDSFSLHESSFAEPRVIAFGRNAEFILTFNGGTHMRAGNAFEVMQYDHGSNRFQFREIAFKTPLKEKSPDMLTEADIEFENQNLKYTKANPNKCTNCHGQPARPIWETYFIWPGAYGGNDDSLTSLFNQDEIKSNGNYSSLINSGVKPGASQGRLVDLKKGMADKESAGYLKYIGTKAQHSRYKFLPDRAIDSAFVRLNAGEDSKSIDTSAAVKSEISRLKLEGNLERYVHTRPNFALNEYLYRLTMKSFAAHAFSDQKTSRLPLQIFWLEECFRDDAEDNYKNEALDPLKRLKDILNSSEITSIRKVAGPWKEFYRKFVSDELDMEAEKIQRIESALGQGSLINSGDYADYSNARNPKYTSAIKGRALNRYEQLASRDENDGFYKEAAAAYIAKGVGIELYVYTTNLRRVATIREGGFGYLKQELVDRNLLASESLSIVDSLEEQKNVCKEISNHLTL